MKRKLKPETEIKKLKSQLRDRSRRLMSLHATLQAVLRRAVAAERERDNWRELANAKDAEYPVTTLADMVAEVERMRLEGTIVDHVTPFGVISIVNHPLLLDENGRHIK